MTPPLIHRSVYTRGFYSPSPWAVRAVELLFDTPVVFRRHVLVDVGGGNWEPTSGPKPPILWQTLANVELTEDVTFVMQPGVGPYQQRRYDITCPVPADALWLPKSDDFVEFTDAQGRFWSLRIDRVDPALNMLDHIEVTSEAFE
jgi:hypothetical protein